MVRVFIDRVISFELSEGILILLFTNIQNQELNTVHDPHSPVYASRKKVPFPPLSVLRIIIVNIYISCYNQFKHLVPVDII